MEIYNLSKSERKFAELIWEHEPISSGELVKLSQEEMGWKKSTTYTVLKKLCEHEIFQNNNAVITSLINKDEYCGKQSIRFVEDNFGGMLPKFLTAFIGENKLNKQEAEELKQLIDKYNEV